MPKTLLLADDSVTIQKVVGLSFANEDVVLLTADNGDQALARVREQRPDLVLADVVMPGKNGYEVCEAVKSDPALRHIPVLLLTGTFEAFDEERAQRVGADGHITKPFEAQALVDHVNALLARAAARPQSGASRADAAAEPETSGVYDFFDEESESAAAPVTVASAAISDDAELAVTAEDDDADLPMPMPASRESAGAQPIAAAPSSFDTDPLAEPIEAEGVLFGDTADDVWSGAGSDETRAIVQEDELAALETDELGAPDVAEAATDLFAEEDGFEIGSANSGRGFDSLSARPPASLPPPMPDDDAFDFGFEESASPRSERSAAGSASLGALAYDDLSRETVIDPEGARGYDVSWSDLGDPLADSRPINSEPEFRGAPEPAPSVPSLSTSQRSAAAASSVTKQSVTAPTFEAPPAAAARSAAPTPVPAPIEAPAAAATPAAATPAAANAAPASPDLTPALRQQVHETLEKIAWEAFSDLSDTIVRQLVERVESIAWEVIPQMAEVLIREEIRRLKGEQGAR